MNSQAEERNAEIYECRMRGKTLHTIAEKYGISAERARQIINRQERKFHRNDEKTWLSQFDERTKAVLIRNGISSEAELHAAYDGEKKIEGLGKRSLKEISLKLDNPLKFKKRGEAILKDLTGQRFGRLTVIKRVPNQGRSTRWLCKCDCGNEVTVERSNLIRGATQSCGCKRKEYFDFVKNGGGIKNVTRCKNCCHNSNREGNYVDCDILPQMFGKNPNDNYCSMVKERTDEAD